MARAEPPVPDHLMAAAYLRLRAAHWPEDTLEAALLHPTHGPAIKGLARSLQREATEAARPVRIARPWPLLMPRLAFDARKAAANDRDDDA